MTVREALNQTTEALRERAGESAGREAEQLLMAVLGRGRLYLYAESSKELPGEAAERLVRALLRRQLGEPLQYILGSTGFMGLDIVTDSRALIPRPETELLAEIASDRADALHAARPDSPFRILDLCTGTGCLARYLAAACPYARVTASDVSKEALSLAAENCGGSVELIQSDLFEDVEGRFSLIVSNPPYIPSAVIDTLETEVKDHEPRLALDGGEDGLAVIRRILKDAGDHLAAGGALLMEIGFDQGAAAEALAKEAGFSNVCVRQDLNGLDRILTADW